MLAIPYDMLRYDEAYPASEQDARRLVAMDQDHDSGPVTIHLCSTHRPTADRWSSFLWTVQ